MATIVKAPTDERSVAIQGIVKEYNAGVLTWGGSSSPVEVYETGILDLDLACGIGGIPRGRVIEVFGPPSSGKTLLILKAIATAQQLYKKPSHFEDAENATPPSWMELHGINLKLLEKFEEKDPENPLFAEDKLNMLQDIIPIANYAYVVIDSVPSFIPKIMMEKDIGEKSMAPYANLWSTALPKLVKVLARSGTTLILINQLRDNMEMWGPHTQTVGGWAIKHYSTMRISVGAKPASTKQNALKEATGHTIIAKCEKNKVAPPMRVAEFDISYINGVNSIDRILANAEKYKVITSGGGYYKGTPHLLGYEGLDMRTKETILGEIAKDLKLQKSLTDAIKAAAGIIPVKA